MTIAFKSFCLGVILTSLCAAVTQPSGGAQSQESEAPPFSIALSAVSDSIQAGSPLMVKIVTTNTSDHMLVLRVGRDADQAGWGYGAVVLDENGNAPPDTTFGRLMKYPMSPNRGMATWLIDGTGFRELNPGESFTTVSNVGRLYDFSGPGKYEIYVRQSAGRDFAGRDSRLVNSNTIAVTVHAAAGGPPAPSANPALPSPPFTVTVAPPGITVDHKTAWGGFAGIALQIVTKNISDRNILLWVEKWNQEQAGSAYQVNILAANTGCLSLGFDSITQANCGESWADTEFGRQAKARMDVPTEANPDALDGSSGERMVLKAGESWTDTVFLSKLYGEPPPGEYTIQVQRFDPATKTMVKSNEVTITISP